ncbi:CLC1 Clathrin light chain [Candida maltosa Xu316]
MADKFPEIDSAATNGDFEGDFLSREKELVGDEFKTDQDHDFLKDEEEDDEINEFKEQFPEVDEAEPVVNQEIDDDDDEFEGFESSKNNINNSSHNHQYSKSQAIKEWKERRDLEIGEREKKNKAKKEEILEEAKRTIDDFYENYNLKKDNHSKDILTEEDKFVEKRDNFLKRGTLWDRVNELVTEVGEVSVSDADGSHRDKTRFKELLNKLKNKDNVPGAGGYQD